MLSPDSIGSYIVFSIEAQWGSRGREFDSRHSDQIKTIRTVSRKGSGSDCCYGPIAQLGERSVRIREVKGSNPSRSTFSSSVIVTLLLFFCVHISHTLALGPRGIRTARPCRRQGKQSAQCNGDDRSQWLKQGGAVGAAF